MTTTELNMEIARITALTRVGIVQWEKNPGEYCTYRTCGKTQPRLVVSCCKPECYVEHENERVTVSCSDLTELCNAIVEQIKWSAKLTAKAVTLLRKIQPAEEGGAA